MPAKRIASAIIAGAAVLLAMSACGDSRVPEGGTLPDGLATYPLPEGLSIPRDFGERGTVRFSSVAPGETPNDAILVATVYAQPTGTSAHVIAWLDDGEARQQVFAVPAGADPFEGNLVSRNSAVIAAVQQMNSGRELGIVYDHSAYGSGSPQASFALLSLQEGEWHIVWESSEAPEWRGSHGSIAFPRGDLNELAVNTDSWPAAGAGDELSGIFSEANAGPHRRHIDTWVRAGDAYVRRSTETVTSPFATLVEFLYALSTGDEPGARERATDGSVIALARELGMDDALGKEWLIGCRISPRDCGLTSGPIEVDAQGGRGDPRAVFYFAERNGRWLITGIEPNDSP